jgi:hypothetical protein
LVEADHDGGGCRNRSNGRIALLLFIFTRHGSGEVKMFSGLQLATVTVTIAKEGAATSTVQTPPPQPQTNDIPPLAAAAATAPIVVSVKEPNDVPVYLF